MKFSSALILILAPMVALAAPAPNKHKATAVSVQRDPNSLNERLKSKGKLYFGTATDKSLLTTGQNAAIIEADFGQVTLQNSMKWDKIEPKKGKFSWKDADYVVKFATENSMSVRGHTLVCHKSLPDWVLKISDKKTLTSVLEKHITKVVKRYKGKVRSWDVVNEIFNEDGTMRSSIWYDVLGEDFVSIAFNAARAADPSAKLYINDYTLENATYAKVADGMVAHVKKWIADGVPIDGIGSQSHINAGGARTMEAALTALADTGVSEVAVTELDIPEAASADYVQAVEACLNVEKCVGVTLWGVRDTDSWRADVKPLLFDGEYAAKPAYTALASSLE
ncbi:Beta-xylanase [Pleurostoma richardsiae]|uniref:Beta-xylanase n=1 Tax=Pleurostoma richardsiae TaxID=41990 RepID=A0AA38RRZ1_9PEZI|nr:Beta-xylanase [Pleurostoma richardsiae]